MSSCQRIGALAVGLAAATACSRPIYDRGVLSSNNATDVRTDPGTMDQRTTEARDLQDHQQPTPAIGGGPTETTADSAVSRLAAARCNVEARCRNLGPHERYTSYQDCLAKLESEKRAEITAANCPKGVDEEQLKGCIQAIRTDDCGNATDAISRVNECRLASLCPR